MQCPKCRRVEIEDATGACRRCHAIDQLLLTAAQVHGQVAAALADHLSLGKRTVARAGLIRLRADVERVHDLTGVAA